MHDFLPPCLLVNCFPVGHKLLGGGVFYASLPPTEDALHTVGAEYMFAAQRAGTLSTLMDLNARLAVLQRVHSHGNR